MENELDTLLDEWRSLDGHIDPDVIQRGMLSGCPQYKSALIAGNLTVYNTKRFNWFQKRMIKFFFGFDVQDIKAD